MTTPDSVLVDVEYRVRNIDSHILEYEGNLKLQEDRLRRSRMILLGMRMERAELAKFLRENASA